jgi:hypothetical protein
MKATRDALTPDDLVTAITNAPSESDAIAVLSGIPVALLNAVADLLYIDPVDGHGRSSGMVRKAVVKEARS